MSRYGEMYWNHCDEGINQTPIIMKIISRVRFYLKQSMKKDVWFNLKQSMKKDVWFNMKQNMKKES